MLGFFAHLGTGTNGFWAGLVHPFTGIDHLLAMVAVGILAAVTVNRRIAWATPAGFVGGMITGGILGVAGVGTGFIDTTVAASIVVLAGLIAATLIPRFQIGSWVPFLAVGFGAIHGIAHGGEVPSSANPVAYVAGFVAATVALHLAGMVVGTTIGQKTAARAAIAGVMSMAGVAIIAGVPI